MKSRHCLEAAVLAMLLQCGCASPDYEPAPAGAKPIELREPQERAVNGGRIVFPKGRYNPVAGAYEGVLYLPEGYVYAPSAERHFRAGVLVPVPGASDPRQGLWEMAEQFGLYGQRSLSGQTQVVRFEPPLLFESMPDGN